jgi:hypothetical protein
MHDFMGFILPSMIRTCFSLEGRVLGATDLAASLAALWDESEAASTALQSGGMAAMSFVDNNGIDNMTASGITVALSQLDFSTSPVFLPADHPRFAEEAQGPDAGH